MTAVRGVRSWLATGDWGQYRKHPWWAALLFGPAVAAVAALIAGAAWRTLIVPGPDGATVIPVQHASSSRPPPLPPHRAASARPSAPARPSATRQPPRPAEVVPRDTSSAPAPTWPASSNRPSPSSPVPALSSPPSLRRVPAAEFAAAVHRAAEFAAAVHRAADHGTAQPGREPAADLAAVVHPAARDHPG